MIYRVVTLLAALSLFACGGGQPETTSPIEESSLIDLGEDANTIPASEPACPGDSIQRADLNSVLDAGPAPLLALVETKPRHRSGRFVGFEIVAFTQGDSPACPALLVGDVVVSVNGKAIERPEHYFEVFQALRGAAELKLEIIRAGQPKTISYTIAD